GLLTLNLGNPGTSVKNPTRTGSNVRAPMLKRVGRLAAGWSKASRFGTDPLCRYGAVAQIPSSERALYLAPRRTTAGLEPVEGAARKLSCFSSSGGAGL